MNTVISILGIVVPFLSTLLMFYLAVIKDSYITKISVYKERLEKYYVPFYQLYSCSLIEFVTAEDMAFSTRSKFLDLFSKNIHYMDKESQQLYSSYYLTFLHVLEAEDSCSPNLDIAKAEFANAFNAIAKSTLTEYKRLLKKLKMPVPNI